MLQVFKSNGKLQLRYFGYIFSDRVTYQTSNGNLVISEKDLVNLVKSLITQIDECTT